MNTSNISRSAVDRPVPSAPVVRTIPSAVQPAEAPPQLRLIAIPGARVLEFHGPELIIGRHSSSDLRLPNREVSRFHCRLYHVGHKWHAEDMNSLNGTMINGESIKHAVLQHNDVLRIADYLFQVDLGTGIERASECQFLVLPDLESQPPSEQAA